MNLKENLLLLKLRKERINISRSELEEIMVVYNNLISFCFDGFKAVSINPYNFVVTPKIFYGLTDCYLYEIFMILIEMKRRDLLKYLDVVLLLDNNDNRFYPKNEINNMYHYLKRIIEYEDDDAFLKAYLRNDLFLIQNVIENDFDYIQESKYISSDYKSVITLYSEILSDYYSKNCDVFNEDYSFESFINLTYYYFLINNLFCRDLYNIYSFLLDIKNNIVYYVNKLNLVGIKETNDMFKYIDSLYKSKNKEKIKII